VFFNGLLADSQLCCDLVVALVPNQQAQHLARGQEEPVFRADPPGGQLLGRR
jgi:hypothetical protein